MDRALLPSRPDSPTRPRLTTPKDALLRPCWPPHRSGKAHGLLDGCVTLRAHTALLLDDVAAAVAGKEDGAAAEVTSTVKGLKKVWMHGVLCAQIRGSPSLCTGHVVLQRCCVVLPAG